MKLKLKQTLKTTSLLFVLLVLVFSSFAAFLPSSSVSAASAPKSQSDCPSGTTFVPAVFGTPASCQKNAPKSQSDCPSGTTFVPSVAGIAASCQKKAPTSQKDCPSGTTFHPGVGTPATCDKNAPTSQSDCPSGTTFVPSVAGIAASCGGTATTTAPGSNGNTLGCEATFTNIALTWILCPVIDVLVGVANSVDGLITDELDIKTDAIFCNGPTCQAYYTAWQTFRNIALGLMVIAGLVMVTSQALGMELLDAYTIRKVLPRILIAAIGITLSWSLMKFLIQASDDLGFGIRHIIYAPFMHLGNSFNLQILGGGVSTFFGSLGIAGVGGVVLWGVTGGIGILLSVVGTAALAVLVALLVLTLRQILIILLMLLAPIAIVAYILPNTHRFYKLWWESFSKALLMFPLIAAFIATGRVFSSVSFAQGDTISEFIGVITYFAPYFMIPLTFRLAGGALSGMGNFVTSRTQGGFGALSNYRKGQRQSRVARMRTKGLWRPESKFGAFDHGFNYKLRPGGKQRQGRIKGSISGIANTIGNYTVDADEAIPIKLGGDRGHGGWNVPGFRRGAARDWAIKEAGAEEQTRKALQEVNPGYKGGRMLGGLYKGAEHDYTEHLPQAARDELDERFGIKGTSGEVVGYRHPEGYGERMQVAGIFAQSTNEDVREGAAETRAAARRIERYNNSHETNRVDGRFLGLQAAAVEGRLGVQDIVDNHNQLVADGMTDKAMGETVMLQSLIAPKRTSAARGHGIAYNEDGTAYNVYNEPLSPKAQTSIRRESAQDNSNGKAEDFQGLHGETWIAGISEADVTFDKNGDNGSKEKGRVELVPAAGPVGPDGRVPHAARAADSIEYKRAKELQGRLKYIAMYNAGDSGVGLEVKRIWERAGLDLKDLEFGGRAGQPMDMSDPRARPSAPEPAAEPQQPAP
jgi:hypothetical protein